MKNLIQIIANLQSRRPKYYVDIIDVNSGQVIKKKYTKENILEELTQDEQIIDWFENLPINEFNINQWLKNGTSFKLKKEFYINMNDLTKKTHSNISVPIQNNGLKGGLNAIDLHVNNKLYNNLKETHNDLKEEYSLLKQKAKKLKQKLAKKKQELFILNIEKDKKPLVSSETIEKVFTGLQGIFMQTQNIGLTGSEQKENLTEIQNQAINFIKISKDEEIKNLFENYNKQKEEKTQETTA